MQRRLLGSTGLEIAPLVLGGHVFGWTADEATSGQVLDRFVDEGFNLIDTADIYGRFWMGVAGLSETVIGNWLKRTGKRSQVLIATKVGGLMGPGQEGLARDYIIASVEGSLRRLQVDCIDLYQSHVDDLNTPQEETMEAFDLLFKQGKVRAIGASNFPAERLVGAIAASRRRKFAGYQTFQPIYNLCERAKFEGQTERICRENGLGVISYSPLACGFLSGKYRQESDLAKSKRGSDVKKLLTERNLAILAAVDEVARNLRAEPAQVGLAWLLTRPAITAPISSATSVAQLDHLIAATRLRLDPASLAWLEQASHPNLNL